LVRPHPHMDILKPFDLVLSNDRELVESLPNGDWMSLFGIRMRPEHYRDVPRKRKNVSLMGSLMHLRHRFRSEGHLLRRAVDLNVQNKTSFGFDGQRYEKVDSLAPYRYQVSIESAKYPDWITEKMWDPLALMTIPIYWGGITKERFADLGFEPAGVIWWDGSLTVLQDMIDHVNRDDILYRLAEPAVLHNRKRVLEIPSGEYMLAEVLTKRFPELSEALCTP